jgi:hypothetical protein
MKLITGAVVVGLFRGILAHTSLPPRSARPAAYIHWEPFLPHRESNQWSLDDLEVMFVVIALMLFPCGAFLFLRRGFGGLENIAKKKASRRLI